MNVAYSCAVDFFPLTGFITIRKKEGGVDEKKKPGLACKMRSASNLQTIWGAEKIREGDDTVELGGTDSSAIVAPR